MTELTDSNLMDAAASTFGISLDEVNWLGNIISCTYVVVAPFVPYICSRFDLRICVSDSH